MVSEDARSLQLMLTAQMLQDAGVQLPQLPSLEELNLLPLVGAGDRPVAVVGAGNFHPDLLRSWIRRCHPIVICTQEFVSDPRSNDVLADVVVGSPDSFELELPSDVIALLVAHAMESLVVTTWGIATTGEQLRALPREQAGLQLAALLSGDVRPVPGEVFARGVPAPSMFGTLAVGAAALLAGLSIIALSDPGLSLVHRVF